MSTPRLPDAPRSYDAGYMSRLLASLRTYFTQIEAVRHVNVASQNFDLATLPISATGLRDGDVYADGNTLKVKGLAGGGGATPGGVDTNVQYNNAGAFAGAPSFVWVEANKRLRINYANNDCASPSSSYIGGARRTGAGSGAMLYLQGGAGGLLGGSGGSVQISGGAGVDGAAANGGDVVISGGAGGTQAGDAGGNVFISAAGAVMSATGVAGNVVIAAAGNLSGADAGHLLFRGGAVTTGAKSQFRIENDDGSARYFTQFLGTGNVNIGASTSDPGVKLNVQGSITSNGTAVSLVGHTHAWGDITSGKPTTIAGYGITDFNSLGDARWAPLSHTHPWSAITGTPTTLAGYGITDFTTTGDAYYLRLSGGNVVGQVSITPAAPGDGLTVNNNSSGDFVSSLITGSSITGFHTANATYSGRLGVDSLGAFVGGAASSPLSIRTDDTERASISVNGNFTLLAPASGLHTLNGVIKSVGSAGFGNFTPSTWGSGYYGVEVGSVGNGVMASTTTGEGYLLSNAYWNGTNWKYGKTDEATQVILGSNGAIRLATAPSGTAGTNITFTERFYMDNIGNLVIGTTSPKAWNSAYVGVAFGSAYDGLMGSLSANGNLWLFSNAYYDNSSNFKYIGSAPVWTLMLSSANDGFNIQRAPSGTAGNTATLVPFLQISNSGLTTLASASGNANVLNVGSDGNTYIGLYRSNVRKGYIQTVTDGFYVVNDENQPVRIFPNQTETLRVREGGGLLSRANNKTGLIRSQDFYTYNTTANVATQYVHLKTNVPMNDSMWCIIFEGYEYGAPKPIAASVGVYCYSVSGVISVASTGSHTCSAYKSTDNLLVLTILLASTYYVGFTVSALQANPPAVSSTEIAVTASSYSASATGVY